MYLESPSTSTKAGVYRLPDALRDQLMSSMGEMRILPTVAMDALRISSDTNASIQDLMEVVERDCNLVVDVMCLANSALFYNGPQSSSLKQAIFKLGFRRCQNLILAASIASIVDDIDIGQHLVRDLLWRHSYTTAVTAMFLNNLLGLGFLGEEFTAGLVHDVGRIVLASSAPQLFSKVDTMDFVEEDGFLNGELETLEATHCEVGAWYAAQGRLPDTLVDVIAHHHSPESAVTDSKLVALISASDHFANAIQRRVRPEAYDVSSNSALFLLEHLGCGSVVTTVETMKRELHSEIVQTAVEKSNRKGRSKGGDHDQTR